ncbi:MAG TPA: hypothetical protein VJ859_02925 [Allosphingosinicella sp.]|nr:hypothetical protein [Allosphingosinicella sp.]
MATLIGPRAVASFPVGGAISAPGLNVAWGYYNATSALAQNDVIHFCRLPKGATVVMGWFQAADIDTGTEALDIDIGWLANGTDAADTDGFGNFGTLDGDAVSMFRPVAGIYYPFINIIQDSGYKTFAAETIVAGLVNTAANAGGTGMLKVVCHYVMGGVATP